MIVFPDHDPAVLYDIYQQVGKNKDLLINTVLNGGVLPEESSDGEEEAKENNSDIDLGDLVGVGGQAEEAVIARQIQEIERRSKAYEEAKQRGENPD